MKKVYYAVQGVKIVETWEQCEKITKYTPLKFKKFVNYQDAVNFVGLSSEPLLEAQSPVPKIVSIEPKPTPKIAVPSPTTPVETAKQKRPREEIFKEVVFYTDGSHIKGTQKMGFGIYTKTNEYEYTFFQKVTPEWIVSFLVLDDSDLSTFGKVSNCTMELLAAAYLFHFLYSEYNKKHIVDPLKIVLVYDYNGVEKWITGEWQAQQEYIKLIRDFAVKYHRLLLKDGFTVIFQWVKGHSGYAGNEKVDKVAKGIEIPKAIALRRLFNWDVE